MEQNFALMFEDIRLERSLILLLALIDPDILRQSGFTEFEINTLKKLTLEELHRQCILKEHIAMSSLESQLE